jgi:tRNA uridine 5-carboxymethylaminomethyl modification enzyme
LARNPDIKNMFSNNTIEAVTIDAKYEGYLAKQQRLVASLQTLENKKIPTDLNYNNITHLRAEAKEKLSAFGPATLGQAGRISGITPADITVIQIHLKKYYQNTRQSGHREIR